jgi:hypothetical protein
MSSVAVLMHTPVVALSSPVIRPYCISKVAYDYVVKLQSIYCTDTAAIMWQLLKHLPLMRARQNTIQGNSITLSGVRGSLAIHGPTTYMDNLKFYNRL